VLSTTTDHSLVLRSRNNNTHHNTIPQSSSSLLQLRLQLVNQSLLTTQANLISGFTLLGAKERKENISKKFAFPNHDKKLTNEQAQPEPYSPPVLHTLQ